MHAHIELLSRICSSKHVSLLTDHHSGNLTDNVPYSCETPTVCKCLLCAIVYCCLTSPCQCILAGNYLSTAHLELMAEACASQGVTLAILMELCQYGTLYDVMNQARRIKHINQDIKDGRLKPSYLENSVLKVCVPGQVPISRLCEGTCHDSHL